MSVTLESLGDIIRSCNKGLLHKDDAVRAIVAAVGTLDVRTVRSSLSKEWWDQVLDFVDSAPQSFDEWIAAPPFSVVSFAGPQSCQAIERESIDRREYLREQFVGVGRIKESILEGSE